MSPTLNNLHCTAIFSFAIQFTSAETQTLLAYSSFPYNTRVNLVMTSLTQLKHSHPLLLSHPVTTPFPTSALWQTTHEAMICTRESMFIDPLPIAHKSISQLSGDFGKFECLGGSIFQYQTTRLLYKSLTHHFYSCTT